MKSELKTRNSVAKWFLIIATITVVITFIASVPALDSITNSILSKAIEEKLVLVCMFFMPLAAIFILIPIVKLQGRSLLLWGLGFVLFPLGSVIWGWVLFYQTQKQIAQNS